MSELLLPLFPLDLVLLPGVPLPLHIFELRYKEMIRECLDQQRAFGIVRAKDESFVNIGCTADIMNVLKTYPDGRMNILVEGQKRFEVLQVNQELRIWPIASPVPCPSIPTFSKRFWR